MSESSEKKFIPETESRRLKLSWFDLRAGHWPDSKDPPWGLNLIGSIKERWPKIIDDLEKADVEMDPGEKRIFWSGEIEFPDEQRALVEIKIWKRKTSQAQTLTDLWIWPKSKE